MIFAANKNISNGANETQKNISHSLYSNMSNNILIQPYYPVVP